MNKNCTTQKKAKSNSRFSPVLPLPIIQQLPTQSYRQQLCHQQHSRPKEPLMTTHIIQTITSTTEIIYKIIMQKIMLMTSLILLTFNNYNSNDNPISPNTQTKSQLYIDQSSTMTSSPIANPSNGANSKQLQPPMLLSQCQILQLSSTTDVDQRCAGKQPCHRLDEPTPNTASTQTTQAGTQPCLSGYPTISNTAQLAKPSPTINEDPFLTRRGVVPAYTTNNPFMFFNQQLMTSRTIKPP